MNDYQKKYLEQSIMQMSQGELLVLTFDEAIKNLKKANLALEDKNYEKFEEALQKTNRVVRYLHQTLDMEQPISRDLARLYDFVTFDLGLVQAGRERRQEELPKLVAIMSDLRDGFLGASKIAKSTHMPKEAKVVGQGRDCCGSPFFT